MRVEFKNSNILYIRYNDYGKYAYHLQFSLKSRDRIRYDNYDDKWPVSTRPHHYHPRYKKEATESQMIGDPHQDCPKLILDLENYIQKEQYKNQ